MSRRAIVLDANILIGAVLGRRVRQLLLDHAARVSFFAPDVAFDEARRHLPALLAKRGIAPAPVMATLDALQAVVRPLQAEVYSQSSLREPAHECDGFRLPAPSRRKRLPQTVPIPFTG